MNSNTNDFGMGVVNEKCSMANEVLCALRVERGTSDRATTRASPVSRGPGVNERRTLTAQPGARILPAHADE
jgi:hypothetical protein